MLKQEADDGEQALSMARGVGRYVDRSKEGEPTMKDKWKVLLAGLSVAGLAATMMVVLLVHTVPAAAQDSCSGVQVNPDDNLDAIVNRDPRDRATTFCVNAQTDGTTATYYVSEPLRLRDGDRLIGQTGERVTRGPATYGVPEVMIRPSGSFDKIIEARGKNIQIQWVDIAGAVGRTINGQPQMGTGAGITAGSADGGFLVQYVVIHGNDTAGILNAKGQILNSEFYDNTQNPSFLGFNGAGVKGITEYQAAYNYVHDNQGNGLWCSVGCKDDPARAPHGFWAHHNLTVDNGRSGIRYETSPHGLATGVHSPEPTALIEENEVHGNSYDGIRGGISAADTQNALIRANVFGAKTIEGVAYSANATKPGAVRAIDSGSSGRTDLWNVDIVDNELNGEEIKGYVCALPDDVVYCANNG